MRRTARRSRSQSASAARSYNKRRVFSPSLGSSKSVLIVWTSLRWAAVVWADSGVPFASIKSMRRVPFPLCERPTPSPPFLPVKTSRRRWTPASRSASTDRACPRAGPRRPGRLRCESNRGAASSRLPERDIVLVNLSIGCRTLGSKGSLPGTRETTRGVVPPTQKQADWRTNRRSEAIGRPRETLAGPSWTLCSSTAGVAAIATG